MYQQEIDFTPKPRRRIPAPAHNCLRVQDERDEDLEYCEICNAPFVTHIPF